MTAQRRLVLQPLEELYEQTHESFALNKRSIDDDLDKRYKPGVYRQVEAFLYGKDAGGLLSLSDHARRMEAYHKIRDGGSIGQ